MEQQALGQIERVSGISSRDFVHEYVARLKPVVLVDMCKDWPAMRWDAAFFRQNYGSLPVNVEGSPTTLGAFFDEIDGRKGTSQKARYLRLLKFEDRLRELIPEFQPLPGYGSDRLRSGLIRHNTWLRNGSPELLIAGGGANFPVLHYDTESVNAFITQIRGDKEFFIYPPDQTPLLYPKPDERHESQIECFDPVDSKRFPLFSRARPLKAIVGPGETIFVPARHWHMTFVQDLSIAVTFNSVSRSNWPYFAYDRAHWIAGKNDVKNVRNTMKHTYLRLVGTWLSCVEAVTGNH